MGLSKFDYVITQRDTLKLAMGSALDFKAEHLFSGALNGFAAIGDKEFAEDSGLVGSAIPKDEAFRVDRMSFDLVPDNPTAATTIKDIQEAARNIAVFIGQNNVEEVPLGLVADYPSHIGVDSLMPATTAAAAIVTPVNGRQGNHVPRKLAKPIMMEQNDRTRITLKGANGGVGIVDGVKIVCHLHGQWVRL